MKPTILCYPPCSTCRKALKWLDEQGIAYDVRHIVDEKPTVCELEAWSAAYAPGIRKFFNTSGLKYRELKLKERLPLMNDKELVGLLATDGMLVKRPILVTPRGVCPGFSAERWLELLADNA